MDINRHLQIIVAIGRDNAIGRNGDLLCHLSADLRRFKQLTTGHAVIMGRRTFESLPGGALPGRRNIVVSRSGFTAPDAEVFPSLDEAIEAAYTSDPEPFVIGGGLIYAATLNIADKLLITRIDKDFSDADTFFPEINPDEWVKTCESETFTSKSGIPFRFEDYTRRQ